MSLRFAALDNNNIVDSSTAQNLTWGQVLENTAQASSLDFQKSLERLASPAAHPTTPESSAIEIPEPVDLSSHHLHHQILQEAEKAYRSSVETDHSMEIRFPINSSNQNSMSEVDALQAVQNHMQDILQRHQAEIDHSLMSAHPMIEPFKASEPIS